MMAADQHPWLWLPCMVYASLSPEESELALPLNPGFRMTLELEAMETHLFHPESSTAIIARAARVSAIREYFTPSNWNGSIHARTGQRIG